MTGLKPAILLCILLASLRSHHLFFRILTEIGNFDDSRLRFLATFDAPGNSYRTSSDARPIAIDYIMHKPGYGNVRRVIRILFPIFQISVEKLRESGWLLSLGSTVAGNFETLQAF